MATKKRLSLIYELENFAKTYLGKVTKFQGNGFFRFGVLSNLLAWRWKTPLPSGMNRVNTTRIMFIRVVFRIAFSVSHHSGSEEAERLLFATDFR